MIMETTTVEDSEDWENLKALKNFQIGIGRLPLWVLSDYGSRQYPRSRCVRERPEHGEIGTQSFVKKTLRQEISIMEWKLMEMTRAETRVSMMLLPAYTIVTGLS